MNKWDKRYLELAKLVGTWSKDPSRSVGAVIIGDKGQIISQGYNGFPKKVNDTPERLNNRETKYKFIVHAEANAIYNSIHNNAPVRNSTIYVTGIAVCHNCAKTIIQSGISKVIMDTRPKDIWKESGELSLQMFKEAGVEFEFAEEE